MATTDMAENKIGEGCRRIWRDQLPPFGLPGRELLLETSVMWTEILCATNRTPKQWFNHDPALLLTETPRPLGN